MTVLYSKCFNKIYFLQCSMVKGVVGLLVFVSDEGGNHQP